MVEVGDVRDGKAPSDGDGGGDAARRAAEYAYSAVRSAILSGRLESAAVVSQVQLALELGVSRTPLREAIRRLDSEGLVTSDFNRRVRVSQLTLPDLDELYAMRLTLEPLGVRITVPYLSDGEVGGIESALAATATALQTADMDAFQTAHRAFHLGLVGRCGPRLERTISDLWDHAERYRREFMANAVQSGTVEEVNLEHTRIFKAAQRRDGAECASRLRTHLCRTAMTLWRMHDGRVFPRATSEALADHADDSARFARDLLRQG